MKQKSLGQVLYEADFDQRIILPWSALNAPDQEDYERMASAVAAVVREQCAQACEMTYTEIDDVPRPCFDTPAECAAYIRSMKP